MAAPPKNRNALRHGLKSGALPAGCEYIEKRLIAFRRQLEDNVWERNGSVGIQDAAMIQTAVRWERHACLAQHYMRKAGAKLKPMESLQFSREIARASTERDRALERLNLQPDKMADELSALYEIPNRITADE